jgi:hypothetical protein
LLTEPPGLATGEKLAVLGEGDGEGKAGEVTGRRLIPAAGPP